RTSHRRRRRRANRAKRFAPHPDAGPRSGGPRPWRGTVRWRLVSPLEGVDSRSPRADPRKCGRLSADDGPGDLTAFLPRATMPTLRGALSSPPGRSPIVAARFNGLVTEPLLAGCKAAFARHGVAEDRLDVAWVPGSFEIPLVARKMAETGRYVAVICLGCVIRGETGHYDHVAGQAASGVAQASLTTGVPVIFGILTTDTVEQALNRSSLKSGNKGADAALAAIEMVNLLAKVQGNADPGATLTSS